MQDSSLSSQLADMSLSENVPRGAQLTNEQLREVFDRIGNSIEEIDVDAATEWAVFLIRRIPPDDHYKLHFEPQFERLLNRIEQQSSGGIFRDDCLNPAGVCIGGDLIRERSSLENWPNEFTYGSMYQMWPVLSMVQGIGTFDHRQCDAFGLGSRISDFIKGLPENGRGVLKELLSPTAVILDLEGVEIIGGPEAVVIPSELPGPLPQPAYPGAVGVWICHGDLLAGELTGHVRATLCPKILPAGTPARFHYFRAPLNIR